MKLTTATFIVPGFPPQVVECEIIEEGNMVLYVPPAPIVFRADRDITVSYALMEIPGVGRTWNYQNEIIEKGETFELHFNRENPCLAISMLGNAVLLSEGRDTSS